MEIIPNVLGEEITIYRLQYCLLISSDSLWSSVTEEEDRYCIEERNVVIDIQCEIVSRNF